jgi:hypothetical protein
VIAIQQHQWFSPGRQVEPPQEWNGLNYLFAAAVVNSQFRKMLLEDPEEALQRGYLGEGFELSREERDRLTSAHAKSLTDLAKTLTHPSEGLGTTVSARQP